MQCLRLVQYGTNVTYVGVGMQKVSLKDAH
jgi:hypothetical protein